MFWQTAGVYNAMNTQTIIVIHVTNWRSPSGAMCYLRHCVHFFIYSNFIYLTLMLIIF